MIIQFPKATNPKLNAFPVVEIREAEFTRGAKPPRKVAPDAIKEEWMVDAISAYFLERGKLRNNAIFMLGVNCGLRCGDIVSLFIGSLVDEAGNFKERVQLYEAKTGKLREFPLNVQAREALEPYLRSLGSVDRDQLLFQSESTNGIGLEKRSTMDVKAVENFLKKAVSDLKLPLHVATHTMRKTFGFRFFRDAEDKNRALVIVMTVLNHSSPEITLRYIGITVDEIAAVYKKIGERSTSNGTTEQLPCRGEVFRPAAWM